MNKVLNIINNKIFRIVAIIVVLFSLVFGLSKSISNSNKELLIVNNRLDRKNFQIYKQKDDKSGYELYNGSGFPEGQKLNTSLTVCVDTNNNTVENIFTYENGKFSVTSNKTVFCTLYFDVINSLSKIFTPSNPLVIEYRGEGYYHDESDKDTEHPFFTRPIYYWYAKDNTKANNIKDSWNVVYAGHCWQMIRTTEQGGVKLLYNGEPNITIVDGETQYDCSDNRNLYHMGGIESNYTISGSKVYGDNFTATTSGTTTTFTLINNDNSTPTSTTIDSSNASTVVGKYTCGGTSLTCTNQNLRKILRITSGTSATIYTSALRSSIGFSPFSKNMDSLAYVGYMYNDDAKVINKNLSLNYPIYTSSAITLTKPFTSSTLFSDSAPTWYSIGGYYNSLSGARTADQIKGSDSDYSALVGKYTFNKTSTSTSTSTVVYYVVAVSGTKMYVRTSMNGGIPSNANTTTYTIGTSITDNFDGTYTIGETSNYDITTWTTSTISPSASNYYYMCADGVSTTCTYANTWFITGNNINIGIAYLANTNNTYGTYKLGTTLVYNNNDTYTLGGTTGDALSINWYREYSNFNNKFICISGDITCAKSNVYYIADARSTGSYLYSPNANYQLTNSYNYSNGTYTLNMSDGNSINTWNDFYTSNDGTPTFTTTMRTKMGKAHYVCLDNNNNPVPNTTSCSNVGYIYYYSSPTAYFMKLNNGQYINTNIDNVSYQNDNNLLWKMLYASNVNTKSSVIKTNIDKWYEANILNTSSEELVDNNEIYCGDRSTSNDFGGWNLNSNGITSGEDMDFQGLGYKTVSINNSNTDVYNLSCPRKTDAYSKNETTKGNGDLTYSIGLISYSEANNTGYTPVRTNSASYWIMSPSQFDSSRANLYYVKSDGTINKYLTSASSSGVRPVIALKSTVEYSRGDGSYTNPYVVE